MLRMMSLGEVLEKRYGSDVKGSSQWFAWFFPSLIWQRLGVMLLGEVVDRCPGSGIKISARWFV